jgi:lipid-A-disaccharide synthase-like uncharacterized protein
MKEDTFNLVGAARHLNVMPSTVRYWAIMGFMPYTIIDGHWVIKRSDLEAADKAVQRRPKAGKRGKRGTYTPVTSS